MLKSNSRCRIIALALFLPVTVAGGVLPAYAQTETADMSHLTAGAAPKKVGNYEFSIDWTSHHVPIWKVMYKVYQDRPNLNYLEIGIFEGRSMIWMLENVLTHPTARATGIDIFLDPVYENRCRANLKATGREKQITILKGDSKEVLKKLIPNSYDIIYVDGSHLAKDTIADAVLSWSLLKNGGVMIFDDYLWGSRRPDRCQIAIDAFATMYADELDVLMRSATLFIVRKKDVIRPVDN